MEKSILALDGFVPLVVGIAIFILLLVMIFKALQEASFFRGRVTAAIVAGCVSLLSVIGMARFFGVEDRMSSVSENTGGQGTNWDIILLLYAALGIAILLLSLYLFLNKLSRRDKSRKPPGDGECQVGSAFQSDMRKSDSLAEENLGKAFEEREMARDNTRNPKPIEKPLGERVYQSDILKETKSNRIKQ